MKSIVSALPLFGDDGQVNAAPNGKGHSEGSLSMTFSGKAKGNMDANTDNYTSNNGRSSYKG